MTDVAPPTPDVAPPAPDVAQLADVAGPHVRQLLARVEQRLIELGASAGPVIAPHAGGTIAAGGKRLRPLLVLIAAGPPPADDRGLVRAAVAVELVHAATLVHDDVLDDAVLRRGRPTVVSAAGREVALATGDLLFARAFSELSASGSPAQVQVLSQASSALARGELLQRHDAWDASVSVARYFARCELKTARLFEAACALGALQASGTLIEPAGAVQSLAAFGRRVGLAFQILDDVLDVSGPAARTGKQPGADLLDGTVTLPFILARESDPALAALDPRSITTAEQASEICERIIATGALSHSRSRALELVAQAKAALPDALFAGQRRALELVADGVVARYA